ncbi:MAG: DNA repair protein RecO [Clostridiales bacterium]|nr:DNA repair protein RecO [Clostridiales bacterium]
MSQTVIVTGIVLATMPIGDYDKRLTILTRERGKITAFAKGARRPNSALLACSQPFTFGEFMLYEGRTSYNVQSVNIKNYFGELRNDISMVYYGLYFCEFTDYITREGNDETELMKLLYQSLRALMNERIGIKLVRYIFELKAIALSGEAPQVFECVKCGETENLELFSIERGGMLCSSCKRSATDLMRLKSSTVYTMQFILSTPVEKLYSFTVQDDILYEFKRIMDRYRAEHIDHKMKSLELLDIL